MEHSTGFVGPYTGLTGRQVQSLTTLLVVSPPDRVHHGDAIGGDAHFHGLVRELLPDCKLVLHPAERGAYRAFCKAPEHHYYTTRWRCCFSVVRASSFLIVCTSPRKEDPRSGTWATVRYARKLGKPVAIIQPDGTIVPGR